MSKGAGKQTTTTALDPATQAYQQEIYRRAQAASNQPYTPYQGQTVAGASDLTNGAADTYQHAQGLAGVGVDALGGNQDAFSKFMNPYQQNVIDALGSQYDRQRTQAALGSDDQATSAGAYGGDRNALVTGERQGALDRAQMSDTANLLYQGYNGAQDNAYRAANLGLGAAGNAAGLGDYYRQIQQQQLDSNQNQFNQAQNWDVRNLGILTGAQGGPYGQTQSTPLTRNVGAGILGGAATGAQLGSVVPGIGTAVGAGIGGILGLF